MAYRLLSIYQNCNMAPRFSEQNCKFVEFPVSPKGGLYITKAPPNIEVCPERHVRILIYRTWPIASVTLTPFPLSIRLPLYPQANQR